MDSILQQVEDVAAKARALNEKFKLTAVGCLINFLRDNGPATLESLVDYISLKRDVLLTAKGEKFTKSAAGIVKYVLSWHPKIFLIDSCFNYYLSEEEAAKCELEYKNKEENRHENENLFRICTKRETETKRQKRMALKRIRLTIESDLKKPPQEYSPITKAYLVLTSGDIEVAAGLRQLVRKTYTELVELKQL
ncbi:unnamed protein product [Blepharisma stoltei]|uniref:Uncharacterized protein n=1 Tax=Blepharisma stoltei TaxID=1481888 RepID=A0AAU9K4J1_9CILI|nr:unnamed protein product [Blepharisma stoltei]